MTYTINEAFVGAFERKLESFKRKYAKFGKDAITYTKSDSYYKDKEFVVDITVEGSYKVSGYTFVASLEYVAERGENLIKTISSDVVVPDVYRTRCECDHCKSDRQRKYTVLLQNDATGEYVQVGKSCVVDYLGANIENYASFLSLWKNLEEFVEAYSRENRRYAKHGYEVSEILGETWEYVKRFGYVSAKASEETGEPRTSSSVFCAISGIDAENCPHFEISDESKQKAQDVIDFVNEAEEEDTYNGNLKILLSLKEVEGKNFGLVVSAVGYYLRETAKKKAKAQSTSEYIGSVGDKVSFTAVPNCIYSYDSDFGRVYIYKFDVDGNEIVWKTSKCLEDAELTIKGTIKATQEYRGIKQTEVTRCRVQA